MAQPVPSLVSVGEASCFYGTFSTSCGPLAGPLLSQQPRGSRGVHVRARHRTGKTWVSISYIKICSKVRSSLALFHCWLLYTHSTIQYTVTDQSRWLAQFNLVVSVQRQSKPCDAPLFRTENSFLIYLCDIESCRFIDTLLNRTSTRPGHKFVVSIHTFCCFSIRFETRNFHKNSRHFWYHPKRYYRNPRILFK